MSDSSKPTQLPAVSFGVVAGLAVVKLTLHLATNAFGPYEFHRDEFLYMAMGEHLRLWHMDFPPFIAMLSAVTRWILGDSLVAVRFPPALMSTALLVIAALTARELGGRRFAQGLAAFAIFSSTLFLRSGSLFQPVVIDQLWWTLALFSLIKLCRTNDARWWLLFGVATGLGLLSKFSVLVFGFATFIALIATPARRWLKTPWPWGAALISFAIGSPSIVGQLTLGFPVLDQMGDLINVQLARVSPLSFLIDQPRMQPGFVIAVIGASGLAFGRAWRSYRLVGWTCIAAFVLIMTLHGKGYYIGPVYPVLVGAGAVAFERFRLPARWGMAASMVVYVAVLFPLGLPVLPPETMERYLVSIGLQSAATTIFGNRERIPQDYADMLNWEAQVREIGRVYEELPPEDRRRAVILASNYGEAGAIDFYGPSYGLPKAVAFVGTYWFFGPGELPGDVIVLHGYSEDDFADFCESRTYAGYVTHPFAVTWERDVRTYVCRGPRQTLQQLWPSMEGKN